MAESRYCKQHGRGDPPRVAPLHVRADARWESQSSTNSRGEELGRPTKTDHERELIAGEIFDDFIATYLGSLSPTDALWRLANLTEYAATRKHRDLPYDSPAGMARAGTGPKRQFIEKLSESMVGATTFGRFGGSFRQILSQITPDRPVQTAGAAQNIIEELANKLFDEAVGTATRSPTGGVRVRFLIWALISGPAADPSGTSLRNAMARRFTAELDALADEYDNLFVKLNHRMRPTRQRTEFVNALAALLDGLLLRATLESSPKQLAAWRTTFRHGVLAIVHEFTEFCDDQTARACYGE